MKKIFYLLGFLTFLCVCFSCKNEPNIIKGSSILKYTNDEKIDILLPVPINYDTISQTTTLHVSKELSVLNYQEAIMIKIAEDHELSLFSEVTIKNVEIGLVKIFPEINSMATPLNEIIEESYFYIIRTAPYTERKETIVADFNPSSSSENELIYDPKEVALEVIIREFKNTLEFNFKFNNQIDTNSILVDYEVTLNYDYEILEK